MPDYSKGKIYTIRFHKSNEIYIGSTIQSLGVRFGGHKKDTNTTLSKLINNKYNGDWKECYYELYENYSCNNKEELCKREGEIIRQFKKDDNYDCINRRIECRTKSQYYNDNIEKYKEIYKKYYEDNIEKYKKYYNDNIDIIKERKKEKIICECGSCVIKNHISRHYKSKKHQEYLESLPTMVCDSNKSNTQFIPISI